jgi:hypothetical protein
MEMDDDFDMQNPLTIRFLVCTMYVCMYVKDKLPLFTHNPNMLADTSSEHTSVVAITCPVK